VSIVAEYPEGCGAIELAAAEKSKVTGSRVSIVAAVRRVAEKSAEGGGGGCDGGGIGWNDATVEWTAWSSAGDMVEMARAGLSRREDV
jgi:hypothetical protein